MRLSSCRDLKQQLLSRAYRLASDQTHRRRYTLRRQKDKRKRTIQASEDTPVAAIGVAPGRGRDYKLAVRLFRGEERHLNELLRGLGRYRDEIDLVTGLRYRPRTTLVPGGSIGHYKISAGTLGGFVEDDEHYYMMSNNHVFANSNQCFGGDPVVQPGPADAGGTSPTVVGNLHKWFPLSKIARDGVDVAIATFSDEIEFFEPWDYAGIGQIETTHVTSRTSVTHVVKRGRTTGVRHGTVSAFELDGVQINYGTRADPAVVTFDDQIEIIGSPPRKPFSAGGDSGSFIIDCDTMQVYALLYGGGPDANRIDRTLAHFIPDVFKAMRVRLVQ